MMGDSVQREDNGYGDTKLELRLDETLNRKASVGSQTENDGNVIIAGVEMLKTLDANRYATKKTIAQGMLDIALLTANASQLKYILQVGHKHEFYTLMLSLIIISIVLQVSAAILYVIMAVLKLHEDEKQNEIAWILNQTALGFVTGAMFCDVVKMSFGLDPALAATHGLLCVFLGSKLNINKDDDQEKANKTNNICLALNILIVVINVIISAFDMRDMNSIIDVLSLANSTL